MSIRLRLTLLYSAILALTLIIFGIALYTIQAQYTLNSLKRDLTMASDNLARSILWTYLHPDQLQPEPRQPPPPPVPLETLSGEATFREVRERDILRVLDSNGTLVSSPFSGSQEALPLTAAGLQTLQNQQVWWESVMVDQERLLVYNRPIVADGKVIYIVQNARRLTERDRSLVALARTLLIASLLTTIGAFGIGWVLSGTTLRPIHHITRTAQEIGSKSDFTRRVDYRGPNDEIGQLATTFNSMLRRLQDAYQSVSQALQMQQDFVADVSHELRTPLTTVRGNLALLHRDPPLPAEEQADILSDLEAESDRLIRLVNGLLVLARADTGQKLVKEPVSILSVVSEVCRQARQLDPQREIVATPQDLSVLGDPDALKQVLLILLDNALKHSQGVIRITTEMEENQIAIYICDDGPGIAPEILPHVFDRFFRGEVDPSISGFGLGLPIAKALVEGQQGTIEIDSKKGCGSIVRVRLPISSA